MGVWRGRGDVALKALAPHSSALAPGTPPHSQPPCPQTLDKKEQQFLRTALLNYTACLRAGDGYDLRVVFRLVQLWLR